MGKTLAGPVLVEGIGLFTERDVVCRVSPLDNRIEFICPGADQPIPATIDQLCNAPIHPLFAQLPPRNTNLGQKSPDVITTEHILSALTGLGITAARIELDSPELPIGNGSADLFVDAFLKAGTVELPHAPAPVHLTKPITVDDGRGGSISAKPSDTPRYRYELDYGPNAPFPAQHAEWNGHADEYAQQVAPARTFSLAEEAAAMQTAGLFSRFTPRELLVLGPDGPIDNELRFDNEPARHKLLDLIGDLTLVGRPFVAEITATRSGHALNHQLARQIAEQLA